MEDAKSRSLTLRQKVQLVDKQTLILRPGEIDRLGRHKFRDAIGLEVLVVRQFGDTMEAAVLEAWDGGDRFLATNSGQEQRRLERVIEKADKLYLDEGGSRTQRALRPEESRKHDGGLDLGGVDMNGQRRSKTAEFPSPTSAPIGPSVAE